MKKKVFPIHPKNLLFNQYRDKDLSVDLSDADKIRKQNLHNYLRSFSKRPSILVIGEAPGPRGCRFSGVPFTSEAQLCNGELPFKGQKSSISDLPYSENSAAIFWRVMLPYYPKFFIWNSVPFHPHKREEILSIRNPTRAEVCNYSSLLSEIISLIKPKRIVTVGKKAEFPLKQNGLSYKYVRHPSHGGAKEFSTAIKTIFNNI
ncbi:MAG: uracil-DNA glycosylase [Deltaproteobacteria bacterium]|nr:uracil-DNA glycosylase [Deltaproteobacteria bacterium]